MNNTTEMLENLMTNKNILVILREQKEKLHILYEAAKEKGSLDLAFQILCKYMNACNEIEIFKAVQKKKVLTMDENIDYIKELKELYKLAKDKGNIPVAIEILTRLRDDTDDPCGVQELRKQADDKD